MNNKLNRILSIVALVFMGIFTVALILFFIDPYMAGGVIAMITLVSGFFGIGLFFTIKILMKEKTHGLAGFVDNDEPDQDGELDGKQSDNDGENALQDAVNDGEQSDQDGEQNA